MSAYERALQGQNSTMVITPDSEFFEFLDGAGGSAARIERRATEGGLSTPATNDAATDDSEPVTQ